MVMMTIRGVRNITERILGKRIPGRCGLGRRSMSLIYQRIAKGKERGQKWYKIRWMNSLHPVQTEILKKLLFSKECRYSELKPDSDTGDNRFDFYIGRLTEEGLVLKTDGKYLLSDAGKEFANRLDTGQTAPVRQAKISAWICCIREREGKKQFLVYTRLKQPFYGCQGLPSGKVKFGERVTEAAARELAEETGLSGVPEVVSIKHFIVFNREANQLMEDKFMYLCRVTDPEGEVKPAGEEGKYEWVDKERIREYVTNPFENIDEYVGTLEEAERFDGQVKFEEVNHYTGKF